jgi:4-amino-4-deoxy-L-arabinose transferase-like glycosyltransferase
VAAAVVSAGWWVLLAEWSGAAPFYGQTESGSFLDYAFGYNGLGRVTGEGVDPGDPFGGIGGWGRLFNEQVGGQVSWLIPFAAVSLLLGLWVCRRRPRTDPFRAGWLLWGAVSVVHVVAFSLMKGVFHPYYTLTMAPAIAALSGVGAVELWRSARRSAAGALLLAGTVVGTVLWEAVLLGRTPDFVPGLGVALLVLAATTMVVVVVRRRDAGVALLAAALGLTTLLVGPLAYSLDAVGTDFSAGDPRAGPGQSGRPPVAGMPGGDAPRGAGPPGSPPDERSPVPTVDGPVPGGGRVDGPRLDLVQFLLAEHRGERWIVATTSAQIAAPLILETGEAVMAMGGFGGRDPWPTAGALEAAIDAGEVRFLLLVAGNQGRVEWWRVAQDRCTQIRPALFDCG